MFLMYRALNEFDIACNPLNNGLASKKLIYDFTLSYLESKEKIFLKGLTKEEKENYIKQNMISYINSHQHKLKKKIDKHGSVIRENLSNLDYLDKKSWKHLLCYLSTLNSHLTSGSKIYTDWISATKELNLIEKYCQQQDIHKVAILGSTSQGLRDNNTIVIDLSSKTLIKDILPLIPKKISEEELIKIIANIKNDNYNDIFFSDILTPTNEKFRGFNYSSHDKEICIYRYLPSENVVSILETLQLDLIKFKLFNYKFLMLEKNEQIKELNSLKEELKKKIIRLNDPYMLHIYEEIYVNNKNINKVRENIFEDAKINYTKEKILKLASNIPNIQVKR